MSAPRLLRWTLTIVLFLVAGASWRAARAQSDTTIHVDVRIRTGRDTVIVRKVDTVTVIRVVQRVDTIPGPVRLDTVVWYPTIAPTGDSVSYTLMGWHIGIPPRGFSFPRSPVQVGRTDTVVVVHVDTLRLPAVQPPAVTPPVIAPPDATASRAPELPRVFVETQMPTMLMSGDTLYQVAGVWWCRGPSCAATRASHNLPPQSGSPPPPVPPWILAGKP